jgi:1-acyl-sn-glycerol-3-phosphate acyltransferase
MIRTLLLLIFYAVALPIAALISFPWTFATGDIRLLYRIGMWSARTGVSLAGVRVKIVGVPLLDPKATYVFMCNHVSNIDPPLLLPRIPGRTSVMAKHELFKVPILGRAMRLASLVPVDRGNRDAGIAAVRTATEVVNRGIHMTIYVEGHRSYDGKMLPFKKGPFYLAEQCRVPVVPITISGTHYVMPKGRFAIKPGLVTVIFHQPIPPEEFGSRDDLMNKVRVAINGGLPEEYRD